MTRQRVPITIDAMSRTLLICALAVIVGLDAVGLATGRVLRRRRDRAAGTQTPAAS